MMSSENPSVSILIALGLVAVVLLLGWLNVIPLNIAGRTNLGQAFSPWYQSGDIVQNICIGGGGAWHTDADVVGCVGYGTTAINCNAITSLENQCESYGATWVCTEQNLYCKY